MWSIINFIIYIYFIFKLNGVSKRLRELESTFIHSLIDSDIDEDFWSEDEEEKI